MTAGARAAQQLIAEKDAFASAITDALYAERPGLLEKYGAAGREKCLQDLHYTIEHLIPALDLGAHVMFADYVRWLDSLLRARRVDTSDVVRSLELTAEIARQRMPSDCATAVGEMVRAGLDALPTIDSLVDTESTERP